MENIKQIIQSLTIEDFESKKVNLHIHSAYSDGQADFEDIITQSKAKGYKYISITDHNTIRGYLENKYNSVIVGVEFDVWYKYIFLHLLAYGIDLDNPVMEKYYAKSKRETECDIVRFFAKRNIKELIIDIHKAGGIAVLAHPACCWALNMEQFISDLVKLGLDGIEVYYPYPRWRKYIKFANPSCIEKLADKYNLLKTGGTDLHEKSL